MPMIELQYPNMPDCIDFRGLRNLFNSTRMPQLL